MCLWKILYSFEIFVTTKILLLPIRLNVSLRVLPSYTFAKKTSSQRKLPTLSTHFSNYRP